MRPACRSARGSIRESGMGRSGRVGKRAGRVGSAETRRIPVIRAVSLPIPLQIAESVADSRPRFGEQTATAEGAFIQQTRASARFRGRCCVATEEDPARRLPLRSARAAVTLRSLLACAHLAPRVVADPSSSSRSAAAPASARCPRLRQGQHPRPDDATRKKRRLSADLVLAPPRSAPPCMHLAHGRRSSRRRAVTQVATAQPSGFGGSRERRAAPSARCARSFARPSLRESALARRRNLSTR